MNQDNKQEQQVTHHHHHHHHHNHNNIKSQKQTANINVQIGDYKQEQETFYMDMSFKFDQKQIENKSNEICKELNIKEEEFKNKVVIKLDLLESKNKQHVIKLLQEFINLQKINNKASLFSLLSINMKIYEGLNHENNNNNNNNSIYLITDFVDEIHLMADDIRKIFCHSSDKYSDSKIIFKLSLNNNFSDFNQNQQSSAYFLMQQAYLQLILEMDDSQTNNQLLNFFGLAEETEFKVIFQKIRNINAKLKYKSFQDIPNKSDFLNWICSLQRARYNEEEINILKQIVQFISDQISFDTIFKESNTIIHVQTSQKGVFKFISEVNHI